MNQFALVITAVLPVFCVTAAGVTMRKLNWLTEEADQSLLRMTVNLLAPALIFDSILKNDALKQASNVFLPPLVGFGTVGLGILIGLMLGRFANFPDKKVLRTVAVCVGLYNYGYLPVPLIGSLFDRETLGVLFVHNVGVEIALWTLGPIALGGYSGRGWKEFFSPPVIAILIAVPMNYLNAYEFLPSFITITVRMLGQCAVPMGVILVGAMMADHLHEFHSAHGWKTIFTSCILRMAILPVLFILIALFLPCSRELKRIIIVAGAMPTANFSVILARHYGGDSPTAVRALVATSVVSLVTIPLWLRLGLNLLDR